MGRYERYEVDDTLYDDHLEYLEYEDLPLVENDTPEYEPNNNQ